MKKAGVVPFCKEVVNVLSNFKEILEFIRSLSNSILDSHNARGIMLLLRPRLAYAAIVITSLTH